MSTRDANKTPRGPGRLFANPTNLALAPPYGGVELGAVRGTELDVIAPQYLVKAEEYGGVPVEGVAAGEWCVLYTLMRQWDSDALSTLFANTTTGASGAKAPSVTMAGGKRSGALLTARTVKLLLAPNDPADQAILIYNAGPVIVEGSRPAWDIAKERVLAASWVSIPDGTGRVYQLKLLGDLTL